MTVLQRLREVHRLRGDTFSSYEVIGLVGQAIAEIERLRAALNAVGTPIFRNDIIEECALVADKWIQPGNPYGTVAAAIRARKGVEPPENNVYVGKP